MGKYVIKSYDEKWTWAFESDKFQIEPKDHAVFDGKADILAFLKELKFFGAEKLKFEQIEERFHLVLDDKAIAVCIDVTEKDGENIKLEIKEAKITWKNPEDSPSHQSETNDTTPNTGPAGS